MKRLLLIGLMVFALPAAAQVVSPTPTPPTPDPVVTLGEDWNAMQSTQRHMLESLSKVAQELQAARKEIADLKAKAKPPEVAATKK